MPFEIENKQLWTGKRLFISCANCWTVLKSVEQFWLLNSFENCLAVLHNCLKMCSNGEKNFNCWKYLQTVIKDEIVEFKCKLLKTCSIVEQLLLIGDQLSRIVHKVLWDWWKFRRLLKKLSNCWTVPNFVQNRLKKGVNLWRLGKDLRWYI